MENDKVIGTINDIKKAKNNLERIKNEYKDEPELLDLYLPSAKFLINELENHLFYLIGEELETDFKRALNNTVDLWIRLEGKQFIMGKGPIGVIGSYLQKLNNANRHAVNLIKDSKESLKLVADEFLDISSFDLIATDKGSLKLGLKSPSLDEFLLETKEQQLKLFDDENSVSLKKLEDINRLNNLSIDGFKLLIKTLASVDNESLFTDLKEKYKEKDVMKLLHYAKELVPSSRSPFDFITFEGKNLGISSSVLKTDKSTRKLLVEYEKELKQDTEYITGKGWVRAVDLDGLTCIIRPFHFKNTNIEQIECRFSKDNISSNELRMLLDEFVNLNGFLVFNQSYVPVRIEIEEIFKEDTQDNDEV